MFVLFYIVIGGNYQGYKVNWSTISFRESE